MLDIKKISVAAGVVVTIGTIIGAFITVDSRYAHAQEVKRLDNIQTQAITQLRVENINDKLFELRLKENPTKVDEGMINRYKEQLEQIKNNKYSM